MKKLILVSTLIIFSFAFLNADVYIKQQTKTSAFMNQPAKDTIQETWLGNNKMAMLSDESSFITDLNSKKMIIINHKSKSYVETSLPLDMTKILPDSMAPMIKNMMDGMTITVTANGQTKKVNTWDTKGYDVVMKVMGMEMKMTFWASVNVPFDWKSYSKIYTEVYKAQFRVGEKFIEEFKKVEGYPVLTEVKIMGMNASTTVLEISDKDAAAGVYSIPQGYTKVDKLSMRDMQK